MKIKLLALMIFLIMVTGCIPNSVPTEDILPLVTEKPPISTATLEPVSPSLSSSSAPSPVPSSFQVKNVIPVQRVAILSEMDLKPTTQLLVFSPNTNQILLISSQTTIPVLNIQPDDIVPPENVVISPDHRWFAYLEIDNGFNIWTSSIDGSQHFISQTDTIGSSFRWLRNDQIAVYNKMGLWMDCPSELRVFNPFTGATKDIPHIGYKFCFPIPVFNEDNSRALFLDDQKGWELYDYRSQKSETVLPGLDTSPGIDKYFFHWGIDGLAFVFPASDKVSFVQNLTDDAFTRKITLETIALPHNTINENRGLEFWIPDKQYIGVDLIGVGRQSVLGCSIPKTFAVADLITKELRVYCLDRSIFSDQNGTAWFTYVSADSRFVGWTVRELPSNDKPLGTVILDTDTGKASYLEGYEFLGFGEINP